VLWEEGVKTEMDGVLKKQWRECITQNSRMLNDCGVFQNIFQIYKLYLSIRCTLPPIDISATVLSPCWLSLITHPVYCSAQIFPPNLGWEITIFVKKQPFHVFICHIYFVSLYFSIFLVIFK